MYTKCNTGYTHLVYLALMFILCFHVYVQDVVQFAVNLLVVTLQKKLSSASHKVPLTANQTVGVIPTSRLWGRGRFIVSAPGAETPSYATATH